MTYIIIGYDPGGNHANGVSYLKVTSDLRIEDFDSTIVSTCDEALSWLFDDQMINPDEVIAAGIDSFLSWPTIGVFRPMDDFLKREYPEVKSSIFSVNSAFGAMAIQGVIFAQILASVSPNLQLLNETHPKVAYHAQTARRHDYFAKRDNAVDDIKNEQVDHFKSVRKVYNELNATRMWKELLDWIGLSASSKYSKSLNMSPQAMDHEWDAIYSAWFTYQFGIMTPGRNLMQPNSDEFLSAYLNDEQAAQISSLRNSKISGNGAIKIAEIFKERIMIPKGIEGKVTYYWLPASHQ
ncbi:MULTISPECIES: DUF429 domain-containing protein [unclassified Paenibacillus]|uniref:DUF429 domain-containing protein n=1 Tax=Paenibacillus provencensis TaxID=441151 RepID=A0ABW3QBW6_9BACL|nr:MULTISPECIES: DUF429 domain-containing protein [unclassified Paenibacillus]MCM3130119.1 DUF429 domain-containing protein [Paenibacillus sp. MER 78]SDX69966.1 Protein of unknown function [Paenibacillus sp. PDC88]SFS87890.1 Protein of unknown function [Paenibacillus sp. 453mf]